MLWLPLNIRLPYPHRKSFWASLSGTCLSITRGKSGRRFDKQLLPSHPCEEIRMSFRGFCRSRLCRNLRRGRQSFIMLLGFKAAEPFAGEIAHDLRDRDVDGHVLDTPLKMRAPGVCRRCLSPVEGRQNLDSKPGEEVLGAIPQMKGPTGKPAPTKQVSISRVSRLRRLRRPARVR